MKQSRLMAILTDTHLWVPIAALLFGVALLFVLH
jgi:hypothetical protein